MQPDDFAELVVLTVKSAIAPLAERLAVAEQTTRDLQARMIELTAVRDRLTVVETKAALIPPPVDVEPLIRDRLAPVLATLETVGHKLHAVESSRPVAAGPSGPSDAEIELLIRDRLEPLSKQLGTIFERLAVLDVRPLLPGPAGTPGKDGAPGLNGKDGAPGIDGFNLEDFSATLDGDRTLILKFERDTYTKVFPIRMPFMRQEGIYQDGKTYDVGDVVTWGGSQWHANEETTTKPGDGSKAWTLIVKRGRDGKDGKDAAPVLPVVSVARG
jgi:hypothetical protein